jgi:hypothetical protein
MIPGVNAANLRQLSYVFEEANLFSLTHCKRVRPQLHSNIRQDTKEIVNLQKSQPKYKNDQRVLIDIFESWTFLLKKGTDTEAREY